MTDDIPLTGAQKSHLRGLGQKLEPAIKVGRAGWGPGPAVHFRSALLADELVKVRFLEAERDERAELCEKIATEESCACVGAVGRTALFYRPRPTGRKIEFPA